MFNEITLCADNKEKILTSKDNIYNNLLREKRKAPKDYPLWSYKK